MRAPPIAVVWLCFSALLTGFLYFHWSEGDRARFTPGSASPGHHQIEDACEQCHTPFAGVRQDACSRCHQQELALADDSHPPAKFTDPRNAERVDALDARVCITCHVEHRPAFTTTMSVTQPLDYCVHCHADIATERPSHAGFAFDGCATGGCHNFHDNRALTVDFLRAHREEPELLTEPRLLTLEARPSAPAPAPDSGPDAGTYEAELVDAWRTSAHGRSEVNCSACHGPTGQWTNEPNHEQCGECHTAAVEGFLASRHGMRLAVGLSPMTPAMARQPMHPDAGHRELGCSSCHGAHDYNREHAAVDACLECHADAHSLAYAKSPHAETWRLELAGETPPGSGVSCATCHLPRRQDSEGVVRVAHNQNDTLRPNEKMIRPVCGRCHGVPFAIDALADRALIDTNFDGRPTRHVPSVDMVAPSQ